jgi:hypothetical protein
MEIGPVWLDGMCGKPTWNYALGCNYLLAPIGKELIESLFLISIFLYPFMTFSHSLYLLPQILMLLVSVLQFPRFASTGGEIGRAAVILLVFFTAATAWQTEMFSEFPEYAESMKMTANLLTLVLFFYLQPLFNASRIAGWLRRFAVIWLAITLSLYVHSGTTIVELLLGLLQSGEITSSHLYAIAEPLANIFLTKNIMAMFVVAVFGVFLYFKRAARQKIGVFDKLLFVMLTLVLASRQAILSVIVILLLDYYLSSAGKLAKQFLLICGGVALLSVIFLAAFNLKGEDDGAASRLVLWAHFFHIWGSFSYTGLGVHALNASLDAFAGIDNYHMFFMNQAAAYGAPHCVAFNAMLVIITVRSRPKGMRWLLIIPYWLNVLFQTYGYEYGNLFLYCIAANSANFQSAPVALLRVEANA